MTYQNHVHIIKERVK